MLYLNVIYTYVPIKCILKLNYIIFRTMFFLFQKFVTYDNVRNAIFIYVCDYIAVVYFNTATLLPDILYIL